MVMLDKVLKTSSTQSIKHASYKTIDIDSGPAKYNNWTWSKILQWLLKAQEQGNK